MKKWFASRVITTIASLPSSQSLPLRWAQEHSRSSWIEDRQSTHSTRFSPNLLWYIYFFVYLTPVYLADDSSAESISPPRRICLAQAARAGVSHFQYGVDLRNVSFEQNLLCNTCCVYVHMYALIVHAQFIQYNTWCTSTRPGVCDAHQHVRDSKGSDTCATT